MTRNLRNINRCYLLYGWLLLLLMTTASVMCAAESDRTFKVFDSSDGLADNGAQVIICTYTGRLVISSIGQINFYNGSSFEPINAQSDKIYELPKYTGHYHLYFDNAHHLWVKDKYQVTCIDLMTEYFISDIQGVLKELGFNQKAEDLFVDDDGNPLMLSKNQLYSCKHKRMFPVRSGKKLLDANEYKGQLLMLFYDDSSIEAFDSKTGKRVYCKATLQPEQIAKYNGTSVLYPDSLGYYEIRNGEKDAVLLHVNAKTGDCKVLMEVPYHLNNMVVHNGFLYVPCQYGYWTYHIATGEKNHYKILKRDDNKDIDTDINAIAFDLQGGMWAGTEKQGLLYSKPYESPFKKYGWDNPKAMAYGAQLYEESLKHQEPMPRRVNCVFHDSRGWTWYGTYIGLKLFKSGTDKEPILFDINDGLNNNVVHSIAEDNHHNLWVSTSNGISALMIEDDSVMRVVSYGKEDNVPIETFDNGRAMKLDNGTIIMQSLNYVVEFNPSQFHTINVADIKLYPKLIRLMVNGQTIQPGMELDGKVILDRAITRTKEINLNYDQNTISLLFTGLNYFRPSQNYYRIRIKGYQDDWKVYSSRDGSDRVDNRGRLRFPIIGIQPGKYDVEVQVSMYPDNWPVEPYVWKLSINEPWWRMTIVYVTLGILLLGLMIANFIFYNKNTRLMFKRNNIEGGIIKRIKDFSTMCDNMEDEMLDDNSLELTEDAADLAFVNAMVKVVPYVNNHQDQEITMIRLAEVAEMDVKDFYDVISTKLYTSPRMVAKKLRTLRNEEPVSSES